MAEYIERGALKEYLYGGKFQEGCTGCDEPGEGCIECIVDEIDNFPAADVAPVVRGCWERYSVYMMVCSVCGKHVARHKFCYCPNCGAKMEVGNG